MRHEIENSNLDNERLGRIAKVWQPSRLKGIQVQPEYGVPFLAATQVFDIWPTPRKWIATSRTPRLSERYVEPGWILVTCSGTVGNPIITYSAHDGIVISHDILRVQPTAARMRGYIYAFFRTRHGRAMTRSSRYGNIIKHLEVAHLEDMRIVPDREQIRPGYLQTVLSHSTLGKPLVVSRAYGTSVPELAPADIESLPVPRLATSIEDEIANGAERASELRMKADKIENGAVTCLEEKLEDELKKSRGKKKHGPLRIPLDFDEAMKRAVQVPPPDEAEEA